MLRITHREDDGERFVLKLEGKLVDQWVTLLREICEVHHHENVSPMVLDLAAVEFADKAGVQLLRRLQEDGVRCISGSKFLRRLVES